MTNPVGVSLTIPMSVSGSPLSGCKSWTWDGVNSKLVKAVVYRKEVGTHNKEN